MAALNSTIIFLGIFLILINCIFADYLKPEDVDIKSYCGIAPYPQTNAPIPILNLETRMMGLKSLDHHVFFRHGDRSTIGDRCFENVTGFHDRKWTECPNPIYNFHLGLTEARQLEQRDYRIAVQPYPNKGILNGNCHFGQLTQKGVLMSYNNGVRYARYLNQTLSTQLTFNQLKTRSTDYHRTRETGESFLTGILDSLTLQPYPRDFKPINNIPTFTWVDAKVDALAMNDNMCPTTTYLDKAYKDPKWLAYLESTYNPLQTTVQTLLNNSKSDLYSIFDCTKTLYCHNNPIPTGLDAHHNAMEAAILNYYGQSYNYNRTLSKILYTGVWASEMLPIFTQIASENYTERNIYLYSGHDSNVQSMLYFFDFGIAQWPPYSALLQIEFYKSKDNSKTYVRFLYDAKVVIPAYCKNSIIATELCPINGLLDILAESLPKHGECTGIPRPKIETFKNEMENLIQYLPPTSQLNVKQFINHMDELHLQQQSTLQQQEQPIERSDIERWALANQL